MEKSNISDKLEAIHNLRLQVLALEKAKEDFNKNWGYYTNDAGFDLCKSPIVTKLNDGYEVSPFSSEIASDIKPFLRDTWLKMTDSVIKDLSNKIKKLEEAFFG